MTEFDPYHKWLAIPPAEQPPNHYRLLGLTLFESDPDAIDAAADQRVTFLSRCSTGRHLALSQKLLNEVAAARLCLLSEEKSTYDGILRRREMGESPARLPKSSCENSASAGAGPSRAHSAASSPDGNRSEVNWPGSALQRLTVVLRSSQAAWGSTALLLLVFCVAAWHRTQSPQIPSPAVPVLRVASEFVPPAELPSPGSVATVEPTAAPTISTPDPVTTAVTTSAPLSGSGYPLTEIADVPGRDVTTRVGKDAPQAEQLAAPPEETTAEVLPVSTTALSPGGGSGSESTKPVPLSAAVVSPAGATEIRPDPAGGDLSGKWSSAKTGSVFLIVDRGGAIQISLVKSDTLGLLNGSATRTDGGIKVKSWRSGFKSNPRQVFNGKDYKMTIVNADTIKIDGEHFSIRNGRVTRRREEFIWTRE